MDNSLAKYAQFRYTPHDDEIRAAYSHILGLFPDNFTDTEYREEIALLMAQINQLLKQTEYVRVEPNDNDNDDIYSPLPNGISNERWKIILDTIKLKAALIQQQRVHKFRLEKARLDRLKVDVIPKDEFVTAVNDIVNLVKNYIEPELLFSFIEEMQVLLRRTTKRNDTVEVLPDAQ